MPFLLLDPDFLDSQITPEDRAEYDRIEASRQAVNAAILEGDEATILARAGDYARVKAEHIRTHWAKRNFDTLHLDDVIGAAILSGRGVELADAVRSVLVVDDDEHAAPLASLPEEQWDHWLGPLRAKLRMLDADWRPVVDEDGAPVVMRGWLRDYFDRYQAVLTAFASGDAPAAKRAINRVLRYERRERPYNASLLSLALYREAKRLGLPFTIRDLDALKVAPQPPKGADPEPEIEEPPEPTSSKGNTRARIEALLKSAIEYQARYRRRADEGWITRDYAQQWIEKYEREQGELEAELRELDALVGKAADAR